MKAHIQTESSFLRNELKRVQEQIVLVFYLPYCQMRLSSCRMQRKTTECDERIVRKNSSLYNRDKVTNWARIRHRHKRVGKTEGIIIYENKKSSGLGFGAPDDFGSTSLAGDVRGELTRYRNRNGGN